MNKQRGAALLEATLVAPVVLGFVTAAALLIVSLVQTSLAVGAVTEAARAGAVSTSSCQELRDSAQATLLERLRQFGIRYDPVSVKPELVSITNQRGERLTQAIRVKFAAKLLGGFRANREATFNLETTQNCQD